MKPLYVYLLLLCNISCTSKKSIHPEEYKATIKYLNAQNLSLEEKEKIVRDLNEDESIFPYYQAFDTLAYLKTLNLQTEVNYISDTIRQKLDTFTLQYMAYACYCPQWMVVDSIYKNRPDLDGFYVEPATIAIQLPESFLPGTTVTFIGSVVDNRHLKYSGDSNDPIPGKELYYYYYKVHQPFSIWGESVFLSYNIDIITDEIIGDFSSRVITVH